MDFLVISLFYDIICMPEILFAYIIALIDTPNSSLLHLHSNVFEMIIPQKCSTAAIFYNQVFFRVVEGGGISPPPENGFAHPEL